MELITPPRYRLWVFPIDASIMASHLIAGERQNMYKFNMDMQVLYV